MYFDGEILEPNGTKAASKVPENCLTLGLPIVVPTELYIVVPEVAK